MSSGRKKQSVQPYLVDVYAIGLSVRPLRGLERLVRMEHRNGSGVAFCDNVTTLSESITFSPTNERTSQYSFCYERPTQGFYGQPRCSGPNEAADQDGSAVEYAFTPKQGRAFSVECDVYKPMDMGNRIARFIIPPETQIEKFELTLDLSAYAAAGYAVENPRCEIESAAAGRVAPGRLTRARRAPAVWTWRAGEMSGGIVRVAWETVSGAGRKVFGSTNLDKLATEFSVHARLAKDLHNFVSICYYFVAGYRSLNTIGPEMITAKSALRRSLESIEDTIGAEVIRRTKGKGLIEITPAGEEVLEWWSRFYMRWTPIFPGLGEPKRA